MNDYTNLELYEIARAISDDWRGPYFGAVPYLQAMRGLRTLDDWYGAESARTVITYFLSNAGTWRGPVARAIKAELKGRIGR